MIQGNFDCVAGRDVCGWAWDPATAGMSVPIRVLVDGQLVAEGVAASHRPDLKAAGIGQGNHAFFIPLPDSHLDGRSGELLVTGPDGMPLGGTPVRLQLPSMRFRPVPPLPVPLPLDLAIVAIVKDEAPYLLEWIAHHRLVGVQHFVLFDNGSSDGTSELLARLAQAGILDHVPWPNIPHVAAQRPAYIAGLARLNGRSRWVAFIDADEFMHLASGESVPDILRDYEDAAGLLLPWRLFGSSGQLMRGDDLVVRRFTRRAAAENPLNNQIKTIVQARFIQRPDIHAPQLTEGCLVDEFRRIGGSQGHPDHHSVPDARRIVLNHYFTKSRAEWNQKRNRGQATEPADSSSWQRPDSHFTVHDLNDVEDRSLADRADAIRAEMKRLWDLAGG